MATSPPSREHARLAGVVEHPREQRASDARRGAPAVLLEGDVLAEGGWGYALLHSGHGPLPTDLRDVV